MLKPPYKKRSRMQCLRQRSNKFAVVFILAAVLVSVIATTPPVGAVTTHPIQYQIGCPPSMVDDGSLDYFKAHGFSVVHLIVPDTKTYQTELNKIKSLGMQPIIDIEVPIWNGGTVTTPISNFASYFQSLKNAGWEYVSSEGGRDGDVAYLMNFFKGYVNYNCDQCGLWKTSYPFYKQTGTVMNSWESYYTSEWPYIQQGAKEAASLGKQNGILAGVWEGGSNPILTNSKNGGSPSYKSMLDWSYANGIGFNHFHVWCSLGGSLARYKALGFEQIVANLQVYYPATSSTQPSSTTTLSASSTTPTVGQTVTFTVNLRAGTTGLSKSVKIWHTANGQTWQDGTHATTNGVYSFTQAFGSAGQRVYHAEFAGDNQYGPSSGTVTVNVGTPKATTTTTITASNPNPTVGSGITLTVTVKAGATVLTNKQVTVTHTFPGSTTPGNDGVFNTGSTGTATFSAGTYGSAGQRVYTAVFAGDNQYGPSSGTVTVNVGTPKTATTTTISASNLNPTVGSGITLTVTVKAGATVLTNKQVTVTHIYPGSTTPATNGVFDTGATGTWTFPSGTYGSAGQRVYTAVFAGDSTNAASSGTVTVNVGSTSTTTLTASSISPAVGKSVTFTATLKSGTTLLSGKWVTIYHYLNGKPYIDTTKSTNANGQITFTQTFGSTGPRAYYATFAGDSTSGPSTSNVVTINVS